MLEDVHYDNHGNDEELDIISEASNSDENPVKNSDQSYFDVIIGHIEDLIMDEEFQKMQNSFLEKHWKQFEDLDENKFIYMHIFKEYVEIIEHYIETYLTNRIQGFNMEEFLKILETNYDGTDELEGEIFELLLTFTDFLRFKQMFLDYRAMKEGKFNDFQSDLSITSLSSSCNKTKNQ